MTDDKPKAEMQPASIPLDRAPFTFKTLQAIAQTEFVPSGLRGKPNAILAAILMGRELGLGPMESMRSISIIDGRPSPSAEWMVGRIFEAGHVLSVEKQTAEECTVVGKRYRDGDVIAEMSFTFTMDMAKRAGLANKNNWKHYPEAMLYWRAVAQLARQLFPDVLAGIKHTPEELVPNQVWDVYGSIPEEGELEPNEGQVTDERGDLIEDADVVDAEEADEDGPDTFVWRPSPSGDEDAAAIARVRQYVDEADLWSELALTLDGWDEWIKGTMPEIRAEVRFIMRAMESLGVWQSNDTLHEELRRLGKEHLSELRKEDLVKMAKNTVTKAKVAVQSG